jgi:transposase
MKRGRPTKGSGLVDRVDGSDAARERARVIIGVLGGELTVSDACHKLGIGESRFHQLRERFLAEGVKGLEPRFGGRPVKAESEEQVRVKELEERVAQLEKELKAAEIKTRIALVMPHLLKDESEAKAKDKAKAKKRRVKKKR